MTMTNDQLRRAQMIQLDILKEFHRVCHSNNLKYWLDSGTLLGAVRHKGFIPWDDDLDVGMPREDYEKFLQIAEDELGESFVVQHWRKTKGYYFPFAKIRKVGTVWQEMQVPKLEENGLYIDVFPYDKYPEGKKERFFQHYAVDLLKRAIAVKNKDKSWIDANGINFKRFLRYIPVFIIAPFTNEKSKKIFDKIQQKYNINNNYSCYFPAGTAQYGRYVIPRQYIENLDSTEFEGEVFSCPGFSKEFLSIIYGDYMRLLPEDKRSVGHSIVEFDFGGTDTEN